MMQDRNEKVRRYRDDDRHNRLGLACPDCMKLITMPDADGHQLPVTPDMAPAMLGERRKKCNHCSSPLWTLMLPGKPMQSLRELVGDALKQLPTIGPVSARRLLDTFGEKLLSGMLEDNVYDFLNLMDADGKGVRAVGL